MQAGINIIFISKEMFEFWRKLDWYPQMRQSNY